MTSTLATGAATTTSTAHHARSAGTRPRLRWFRRAAAVGGVAAVSLLGVTAGPASASVAYSGAQASAYSASSTVTHRFSVSPATTPMTGWGSGQYVSYQIAARDVTYSTPGAWKTYPWQSPVVVKGVSTTTSVCNSYDVILGGGVCHTETTPASATTLGTFTVTGYAGHRYEVQVQLGYWMGSGYAYTGWFKANDCVNTYVLNGVTFTGRGASCGT